MKNYDAWKLSGPPELSQADEAWYDAVDDAIAALEKFRDGNGTLQAVRDAVDELTERDA